jgi:hypothetical protein
MIHGLDFHDDCSVRHRLDARMNGNPSMPPVPLVSRGKVKIGRRLPICRFFRMVNISLIGGSSYVQKLVEDIVACMRGSACGVAA